MSKKKNKCPTRKPFAQIQEELKPKIAAVPEAMDAVPKIDIKIEASVNKEIDTEPFRWCFIYDEMRWTGNFGFKEYQKDLKKFLEEIEKPIYNTYHNLTWAQVNQKPHCGKYAKNLNEEQKRIAYPPHKPDDEQLYHIHISQKHVLLGYRLDNVFHITINDPDHKFDKL